MALDLRLGIFDRIESFLKMLAEARRILVIGSVTIDNVAVVAKGEIDRMSLDNGDASYLLLEQGRKLNAEVISKHEGGGAANVSISFARQGFSVDILTLAGDDFDGQRIRKKLNSEGVGLKHFITKKEWETDNSILIYSHDNNATIITSRGKNSGLHKHLNTIDFSNYYLVYMSCLPDNSLECFSKIVLKAKDAGCLVVSNPCIEQLSNHPNELLSVSNEINLLFLNKVELIALISQLEIPTNNGNYLLKKQSHTMPPLVRTGLKFDNQWTSLNTATTMLFNYGFNCFSLTDGSQGSYFFNQENSLYCPSRETIVAGTAGAGDAFASSFVAQFSKRYTPELAMLAATWNASSVIEHLDTQTGLLTAENIEYLVGKERPNSPVINLRPSLN